MSDDDDDDDDEVRLCRLAYAVLRPGFEGTRGLDGVLCRLVDGDGVGSGLVFARDVVDPVWAGEWTGEVARSVGRPLVRVGVGVDGDGSASRRVATGRLREELGFSGLIVIDAIEMRAVADRYGLERAVVMAVAAGADVVCVGHAASDELVARLQATLVNAVDDGELAEERLVDAAGRVAAYLACKGTGEVLMPAYTGHAYLGSAP
jgi:hypothetical protein